MHNEPMPTYVSLIDKLAGCQPNGCNRCYLNI